MQKCAASAPFLPLFKILHYMTTKILKFEMLTYASKDEILCLLMACVVLNDKKCSGFFLI